MSYHRRRNAEPKQMKARFKSKCAESGQIIEKGEEIIYYPNGKSAYKLDTKQAQEFREMQQDDIFNNQSF